MADGNRLRSKGKGKANEQPSVPRIETQDRRHSAQEITSPADSCTAAEQDPFTELRPQPSTELRPQSLYEAQRAFNRANEDTEPKLATHVRHYGSLHKQRSTPTFSPAAPAFQPHKGAASQIALLNKESVPDNEPVVVSSYRRSAITEASSSGGTRTHPHMSERRAGKQPAMEPQDGVRSQSALGDHHSPLHARFSTDVVSGERPVAGHYIQIDKIVAHEYEHYMHRLETQV